MARDLSYTIREAFQGTRYNRCYCGYRYNFQLSSNAVRYLEIPLNRDIIEIPLFALDVFIDAVKDGGCDADAIVTVLKTTDCVTGYKTLDRSMKDILYENYNVSKLIKIDLTKDNNPLIYYGTCGAVFDKDFNPLVVCMWQIEQCIQEDEDDAAFKYKFLRPVIRIHPDVYLRRSDSMERFIAGKMLNTCLQWENFQAPPSWKLNSSFLTSDSGYTARAEIDEFSFVIHDTSSPSISTTNQQLLRLALDHIEDIVQ